MRVALFLTCMNDTLFPDVGIATVQVIERLGHALDTFALDEIGSALTGCALAIAETGTIVLDGGARQGRRVLSLVPDYHLCVVEEWHIVGTVAEAMTQIDRRYAGCFAR